MRIILVVTFLLLSLSNSSFAQEECTHVPYQDKVEEYKRHIPSENIFSSQEKVTQMGKIKIEVFNSVVATFQSTSHLYECFNPSNGWERTKYEQGETKKLRSTKEGGYPFTAKVTFPNGKSFQVDNRVVFSHFEKEYNYSLTKEGVFASDDIFAPKLTFEQTVLVIAGDNLLEKDYSRLMEMLKAELP